MSFGLELGLAEMKRDVDIGKDSSLAVTEDLRVELKFDCCGPFLRVRGMGLNWIRLGRDSELDF